MKKKVLMICVMASVFNACEDCDTSGRRRKIGDSSMDFTSQWEVYKRCRSEIINIINELSATDNVFYDLTACLSKNVLKEYDPDDEDFKEDNVVVKRYINNIIVLESYFKNIFWELFLLQHIVEVDNKAKINTNEIKGCNKKYVSNTQNLINSIANASNQSIYGIQGELYEKYYEAFKPILLKLKNVIDPNSEDNKITIGLVQAYYEKLFEEKMIKKSLESQSKTFYLLD